MFHMTCRSIETQQTFTFSKSEKETLEHIAKYV